MKRLVYISRNPIRIWGFLRILKDQIPLAKRLRMLALGMIKPIEVTLPKEDLK